MAKGGGVLVLVGRLFAYLSLPLMSLCLCLSVSLFLVLFLSSLLFLQSVTQQLELGLLGPPITGFLSDIDM